jgi:acyl-CoA thioesterase
MAETRENRSENELAKSSDAPQSASSEITTAEFGIRDLLGMQIVRAADGVGLVSIDVGRRLMHPQQMVHGGVIFTLADTAMSMALSSAIPPGTPFGTIEAKINYLLPVRSGELLAQGKIIHMGGSTAVMEATIYNTVDDQKQVIARVMGTFYIKRNKKIEKRTE